MTVSHDVHRFKAVLVAGRKLCMSSEHKMCLKAGEAYENFDVI